MSRAGAGKGWKQGGGPGLLLLSLLLQVTVLPLLFRPAISIPVSRPVAAYVRGGAADHAVTGDPDASTSPSQAPSPTATTSVPNDDNIQGLRLFRHRDHSIMKLVKRLLWALQGLALLGCLRTMGAPQDRAMVRLVDEALKDGGVPTLEEIDQLPSAITPDFLPLLGLLVSSTLHALFHLVQDWAILAKCWINYRTTTDPTLADSILVIPKPHRGSKELVPLSRGAVPPKLGKKKGTTILAPIEFIFQHRKYVWHRETGSFQQLRPDCQAPLSSYLAPPRYGGEDSKELLQAAERDFGPNTLDVHVPTLRELLSDRLRSPMTIMRMVDILLLLGEGFPFLAFQTMAWTLWSWYSSVKTSLAHIKRVRKEVMRGLETAGEVMAYREGAWRAVAVRDLVPLDVIALMPGVKEAPVDCLVLHGGAVVDEAILTGESLPQMKRPLASKASTEGTAHLDIEGQHRPHVVFSGTSIIRIDQSTDDWPKGLPALPAINGSNTAHLVGCVLRTGYYSSQGELLRIIDLRSGKVQSDSPEAMYILASMSLLSLASAVGVAGHGLSLGRSPSTILMQCIRILSSGIPFYLMDDFSDTVARGVEELALKAHVVCTEPYRIPLAGQVDTCLFDKTGTLTTEHLFLQGVVPPPPAGGATSIPPTPNYQLTKEASAHAQMVLGACHSLVEVNGRLAGDTLELSALEGVAWAYNSTTNMATSRTAEGPSLEIIKRHDFSAFLQRMSVLAKLDGGQEVALVKGSPESIWPLLQAKPSSGHSIGIWPLTSSSGNRVDKSWYDSMYQAMASDGTRVIALAWRPVPKGSSSDREALEKDLIFAGFAGFRSRVRADSAVAVGHLHRAGVETAVVSGDSLLTSLHVAREVSIVRDRKSEQRRLSGKDLTKKAAKGALQAKASGSSSPSRRQVAVLEFWGDPGEKKRLAWVSEDGKRKLAPFAGRQVGRMAERYELCTEGKVLALALKGSPQMARYLHLVRVYARMTPALKETVVRHMKAEGHRTVLMCGDGANDVGALKQADIGVALLTGFGAANADEKEVKEADAKKSSALLRSKAEVAKEQGEAFKKQFERILQENQSKNITGVKLFLKSYREAVKSALAQQTDLLASATALAGDEADANDPEGISLKLGDASLAAPFTAKQPSVSCVLDIIRQGRASMGMVQRQAQSGIFYSLSNLLYRGLRAWYDLKWAKPHRMALHLLGEVTSVGLLQLLPLYEISPARMPSSVFHPSSLLSVVGQALLHTVVALLSFRMVAHLATTPPKGAVATSSSEQPGGAAGEFVPNAFSNVLFLTSLMEAASTQLVMVKGHPFSTGILDSPMLLIGVFGMVYIPLLCVLELDPAITRLLQLASLPSVTLRLQLAVLLVLQLVLPWAWDRLMLRLFLPEAWALVQAAPPRTAPPARRILPAVWAWLLIHILARNAAASSSAAAGAAQLPPLDIDDDMGLEEAAPGGEDGAVEQKLGGNTQVERKDDNTATAAEAKKKEPPPPPSSSNNKGAADAQVLEEDEPSMSRPGKVKREQVVDLESGSGSSTAAEDGAPQEGEEEEGQQQQQQQQEERGGSSSTWLRWLLGDRA